MTLDKIFYDLFDSPKYKQRFNIIETRTICLKSNNCDDIYVKTNAPKEEIENAIDFQNTYRCENDKWDENFDCDFSIMVAYLQGKGYIFEDVSATSEVYYW